MEQGKQQISLVSSGVSVSETEQGDYYALGSVGIWVEIQVLERYSPAGAAGVRWTIDGWKSHHDTLGVSRHQDPREALWRVEISHLVSIGWRDGSIGGPNGEQPSAKVWTLWGPDRAGLRCLPRGSPVPAFEFALFVNRGDTTHWNNNQGRNFRVDLAPYARKTGSQAKKAGKRASPNDFLQAQG